jgi:hypothetical protein
VLSVGVNGMHLEAVARPFDQRVKVDLDGLNVTSHVRELPVHLIFAHGAESEAERESSRAQGNMSAFFSADVLMCDPISPFFSHSEYGRCAMKLGIKADSLDVLADQETLCGLLIMMDKVLKQLQSTVVELGSDVSTTKAIGEPSSTPTAEADKTQEVAVPKNKDLAKDPAKDFITMDADFTFGTFRVMLRANDDDLAALAIEGLSATMEQHDQGDMKVTANLKALSLKEMRVDSHVQHSAIATLRGDSVFDMTFAQYALPDPEDGATGALTLSLGQLHFIFINSYIENLINFTGPISDASMGVSDSAASVQASLKKAYDAKAMAAAKDAAARRPKRVTDTVALIKKVLAAKPVDSDEEVAKFRLDVTAEAPLIIVPLHASSVDAITLNLGRVQVNNTFAEGDKAEYDRMLVTVSQLRAAVATYDFQTKELVEKSPFLELPEMVCTVDRTIT